MSADRTLEYIIENKCSVSRYGDGEMGIIRGYGIKFQRYDKNLARKLKSIKTTDKVLVCVPSYLSKNVNWDNCSEIEKKFWKKEKNKFEGWYRKIFSKSHILGDALISRFYISKVDKSGVKDYIEKIKKLWENRDIIFVEGYNSRLGYGNDLFDNAKSIRRILCPTENAFALYDNILNSVRKNANRNDLVILALGPTATVLAKDLSEYELQAIDLGHVDIEYEWFKMNATEKVPIPNKHVNECGSLGECDQLQLDKEYLNQIVERI